MSSYESLARGEAKSANSSDSPANPAVESTEHRANVAEQRFYEIDLLRFLAALSVLLFHYAFRSTGPDNRSAVAFPELAPIFKYGYLGVELFFIVSGFVILLTALDRNARSFIISRVTRLYPAYWACVTISFVVILVLGAERYSATLPQYLINLTMLQEFVKVPSIDGVYWTLALELKFYFLVFILVLTRQTARLEYFLSAWLLASAFLDFYNGYNALRFFLFPGYSYFFIAGATFLLIRLHGINTFRVVTLIACYVGAIRFAIVDSKTYADFFHAEFNPWVIGAILTAFFGLFASIALDRARWLAKPGFLVIGALTYPLYLLHQNIGFMLFNTAAPYVNRYVLLIVITLLMLGLAYTIHLGIERRYSRPLKQLLTRILFPGKSNR